VYALARPNPRSHAQPYDSYWSLPLPPGILSLLRAHVSGAPRDPVALHVLWAASRPDRWLCQQDVEAYLAYWADASCIGSIAADDLVRFGECVAWSADAPLSPAMLNQLTGHLSASMRVPVIYNAPTVAERRDALAIHYERVVDEMAQRLQAWSLRPPFGNGPDTALSDLYVRRLVAWAGGA